MILDILSGLSNVSMKFCNLLYQVLFYFIIRYWEVCWEAISYPIRFRCQIYLNISVPCGTTVSHKNYWDLLSFHEKVFFVRQKMLDFPPPSWLNVVPSLEIYARQWWPGMTKQTCNQHWIRGQVVKSYYFCDWL